MGRGWKWGDQFTSNLGPVDGILSHQGGFPSKKKGMEREVKRESARGSKKQGDCTIFVLSIVYMHIIIVCNCLNVECS
jgi:hypothetical protein